jgi:hypothetical protein
MVAGTAKSGGARPAGGSLELGAVPRHCAVADEDSSAKLGGLNGLNGLLAGCVSIAMGERETARKGTAPTLFKR